MNTTEAIRSLAQQIHQCAVSKGWYDGTSERSVPELIALMHSELSEALEAARKGNPPDTHCSEYGNLEVELADCIIRILDASVYLGLDVPGAIEAKVSANWKRPARHGGKKF